MNLDIQSVDLVSTLRTAPKNGAPSSNDYNDTLREILADLGSLSELLNMSVLPVLNALPDTAALGLEGRSIYASLDPDKNVLFYSDAAKKYLTVAEVFQKIYDLIVSSNNQLTDVAARIISLQSKLATTSHNDIINAVQGFTDQVRQVSYSLSDLTRVSEAQAQKLAGIQTVRKDQLVAAGATQTVDINWPVAYADNSYTVALAAEGGKATLYFVKKDGGVGITVTVVSADNAEKTFTVHATGKAD